MRSHDREWLCPDCYDPQSEFKTIPAMGQTCAGCGKPVGKDGRLGATPSRPSILARRIYERAPTGCCLHVVLDDRNERNDDVRFCLEQARAAFTHDPVHRQCVELAELMLAMTPEQRHGVRAAPWDVEDLPE